VSRNKKTQKGPSWGWGRGVCQRTSRYKSTTKVLGVVDVGFRPDWSAGKDGGVCSNVFAGLNVMMETGGGRTKSHNVYTGLKWERERGEREEQRRLWSRSGLSRRAKRKTDNLVSRQQTQTGERANRERLFRWGKKNMV